MRISDWSSDVCSSDLFERLETALLRRALEVAGALEIDAAEERAETVEKMTVEQAIGLLNMHRRSVREGQAARRTPAARHIATQEETDAVLRSEEHTSELQSLMRISYAVFCLKKKNKRVNSHQHK